MTLILDPDDLNQGSSNAVSDAAIAVPGTGADATLTSSGNNLPALAAGEFFEIRDASVVANNGLWQVVTVNTSTTSYEVDKVTGGAAATMSAEPVTTLGATGASTEKSVMFDTEGRFVYLLEQGNLSVDGVAMLALHSFMKEEWKSDDFLIAAAPFPMVGISFAAGQWLFGVDPSGNNNGWKLAEDDATFTILTKRLIRNAGWDETDVNGNTVKKYFNVTTLGDFEDSANDLAYYWFGTDAADTGAAVDYEFAGPVNEPVLYFEELSGEDYGTLAFATSSTITRTTGSFITNGFQIGSQVTVRNAEDPANDGTYVLTAVAATTLTVTGTPFTTNADDTTAVLAVDHSNVFNTALRIRDADPNGKTFGQADLTSAGETSISSKIIKFPLGNITDLDISESDANIAANSPYTEIRLRYLSAAYNREVDSVTKRNFGIIVDVGTYSQSNGESDGTAVFTSASLSLGSGEDLTDYTDGDLIIHEGTDQGTHTISGTPVNNGGILEITLTAALSGTESNLSFTMERASPLTADKNEIYEKIHYLLRQDADIDDTANTVTGRTADDLSNFIGPDLFFGRLTPSNPNGGGSGVIVEGFDANDTNNLFFYDNGGTQRNFPFVAAGTLSFSQNLVDDSDGEYWLYYDYSVQTQATDGAVVSPSGDTYDLESPGGNLPALSVNDYINVAGFAQDENNGLFVVTVVNVSTQDYTVRRVDGADVGTVESGVTITVDENPYPSPTAIIVDDNGGSDIAGPIGSTSIAFDYDYDNNSQGGKTPGVNAPVTLIAAGLESAQVAVSGGNTITRSTGLSFSVTSATERNYSNP